MNHETSASVHRKSTENTFDKIGSKNAKIQKRKNQKIDNLTKQLLIQLTVKENRCSVYYVAKKYGINYQNAKAIVRKYKRSLEQSEH